MKTLLVLLLLIPSLSWGKAYEITNLSCISDDKSMEFRVELRLDENRAKIGYSFVDWDLTYNDDYIKIKAEPIPSEYENIILHMNIDSYSGRALYNVFFSDTGESTTPVQLTCKKLTDKKF